jgi:hypothetical protein
VLEYLVAIPVVLVAGYVIATNHHRWRDFGIGTALGSSANSAVPSMPDDAGDREHAHHPPPGISDGTEAGDGNHWSGEADSTGSHDDGHF